VEKTFCMLYSLHSNIIDVLDSKNELKMNKVMSERQ
jgi:hypothetical protein